MSALRIPDGPWDNPVLRKPTCHALIHDIERCEYRNGIYYRIVLWVADAAEFLVTNIYIKRGSEKSGKRRIWHFCEALNVDLSVFPNRLHELRGRTIQVAVRTTTPDLDAKSKAPYSDVREFFRAQRSLTREQEQEYEAAIAPKSASKQPVPVENDDFADLAF